MELENGLAITVIDNFIDHKIEKYTDTMVSPWFIGTITSHMTLRKIGITHI